MTPAAVKQEENLASEILKILRFLGEACDKLDFHSPVHAVYNPYDYAWPMVQQYVQAYVQGPRPVLFLGMNPGPWGMTQTGIPFGEVAAVREWLGLRAKIGKPGTEHPARPVQGLECPRSEVSGFRFWGLMKRRFGTPSAFFARHFVLNYCPLMFMAASGANITPDKIKAAEKHSLFEVCDKALLNLIRILKPQQLIGVGGFAESALKRVVPDLPILRILHPSPANPIANRDWEGVVTKALVEANVWVERDGGKTNGLDILP